MPTAMMLPTAGPALASSPPTPAGRCHLSSCECGGLTLSACLCSRGCRKCAAIVSAGVGACDGSGVGGAGVGFGVGPVGDEVGDAVGAEVGDADVGAGVGASVRGVGGGDIIGTSDMMLLDCAAPSAVAAAFACLRSAANASFVQSAQARIPGFSVNVPAGQSKQWCHPSPGWYLP